MKRFGILLVGFFSITSLSLTNAPAQDAKAKDDPRLVAIGGLGATATYVSFAYVGVTADSFEKGVYDADTVKSLMTEVQNLMKIGAEQLTPVAKGDLVETDVKSVEEIIAIMGMIGDYAKLLVDYTKAKDAAVGKDFQKQREKTWARLKKLLGK